MIANAQALDRRAVIEQRVEIRSTQAADSRVALEYYKQTLAQTWALCFATVTNACDQQIAFDAVRHNINPSRINMSLAEPEEFFIASRPATTQDEIFRGRRGKLTVIRK